MENGKKKKKNSEDSSETHKRERWGATLKVMKDRFRSQLDEKVFEGVREEKIYHGLKLTGSVMLQQAYTDVCFCDETQEYLVLEKCSEIHRYSLQGNPLKPSLPLEAATMTFARMLWCQASRCLLCYDPDNEYIWLLDSAGVSLLREQVKSEFRTKAVYYVPSGGSGGEIVAVGERQTAKYLLDADKELDDLDATRPVNYNDPEFGPSWQLQCTALVPGGDSSSPTRLVSSYLTTLYLFPLELEEDADASDAAEYLHRQLNAAAAPISALHYHETSKWIVTGDSSGNVTAWNLDFVPMMSHLNTANPVTRDDRLVRVTPHPSICGFLTCSQSGKLQVWSCNFRDKLEAFEDYGQVRGLAIVPSIAALAVLGSTRLYLLAMRQVYNFFAALTARVKWLASTQNPMYPTKVVAASEDNSVRILSTRGGQLNVQMLPNDGTVSVVSAAMSGNSDRLFTMILPSGEILESDASVCPARYRNVFVNDGPRITCVAVYENFDEIREDLDRRRKPRSFCSNSVTLIAATDEGDLIRVNSETGKHEHTRYRAHAGSIVQLKSSSVYRRVVSLGEDRCVKVWRVFADLAEPFAVYYTIYFVATISHVGMMRNTLCMTSSSERSTEHLLLMENMTKRSRLEHRASKDHTGLIVDMKTSETLEICATSSADKTIRIWDSDNRLLKILEVNTCAKNVAFSSVRCDLIFSGGRHLYEIPHENYLPPKYRAKIVGDDLDEEIDEQPAPEDEQYKVYESVVDRDDMLNPVSTTPLLALDIHNSKSVRVDELIMRQICALYEYRDEDIRKIKDFAIKPTKVAEDRALMTADVWEKYVSDLLESLTRQAPKVPKYDFQSIADTHVADRKTYNERGVFQMLFGYSIDEADEPGNLAELMKRSKLPLNAFLPNSVVYKPKVEMEISKEPSVESIVKEIVKYRYPAEFYPEEEDATAARKSIRLSQLMTEELV